MSIAAPTQVRMPWRTVARTLFQMVVTGAAATPLILQAVYQRDPQTLTGAGALALTVAGAITRVMALPVVEDFLRRYVPALAASPAPRESFDLRTPDAQASATDLPPYTD